MAGGVAGVGHRTEDGATAPYKPRKTSDRKDDDKPRGKPKGEFKPKGDFKVKGGFKPKGDGKKPVQGSST